MKLNKNKIVFCELKWQDVLHFSGFLWAMTWEWLCTQGFSTPSKVKVARDGMYSQLEWRGMRWLQEKWGQRGKTLVGWSLDTQTSSFFSTYISSSVQMKILICFGITIGFLRNLHLIASFSSWTCFPCWLEELCKLHSDAGLTSYETCHFQYIWTIYTREVRKAMSVYPAPEDCVWWLVSK